MGGFREEEPAQPKHEEEILAKEEEEKKPTKVRTSKKKKKKKKSKKKTSLGHGPNTNAEDAKSEQVTPFGEADPKQANFEERIS